MNSFAITHCYLVISFTVPCIVCVYFVRFQALMTRTRLQIQNILNGSDVVWGRGGVHRETVEDCACEGTLTTDSGVVEVIPYKTRSFCITIENNTTCVVRS